MFTLFSDKNSRMIQQQGISIRVAGRILMALGNAPAQVDPDQIDVALNGVVVCAGGVRACDRHSADLSGRDIEVLIDLHLGDAAATVLTTDLSHDYVEENSAYS